MGTTRAVCSSHPKWMDKRMAQSRTIAEIPDHVVREAIDSAVRKWLTTNNELVESAITTAVENRLDDWMQREHKRLDATEPLTHMFASSVRAWLTTNRAFIVRRMRFPLDPSSDDDAA